MLTALFHSNTFALQFFLLATLAPVSVQDSTKAKAVGPAARVAVVPVQDSAGEVVVAPTAAADDAIAARINAVRPLPDIACHIIHPIAVRGVIIHRACIRITGKAKRIGVLSEMVIICLALVYSRPAAISIAAIVIRYCLPLPFSG